MVAMVAATTTTTTNTTTTAAAAACLWSPISTGTSTSTSTAAAGCPADGIAIARTWRVAVVAAVQLLCTTSTAVLALNVRLLGVRRVVWVWVMMVVEW